ncbi:hypothetical protein KR222_011094 [Zaprionus bogoriensis]|nr:hypothetical protein KR222_011094 [Zaprionus bogoriensis]
MANSRQETEKMMASTGVGVGHDGSLTLSPANGQQNATLMRHSPDIKKHPHPHVPHPYDK